MSLPQGSQQRGPELDYSLSIRVDPGRVEARHPLGVTMEWPEVGMV